MENRLNVGITHGDVNGISYELIIKLLAENRICELCVPILYGSPKVAAYYRKVLNIENFSLNTILCQQLYDQLIRYSVYIPMRDSYI